MRYAHRLAPDQDRRHRYGSARVLPLEWSDTMAYVVGLIATDGCLVNNGRHLSFGSADRELVETFLRCLGRPNTYSTILTRKQALYYRIQFSDARFHRWLQTVGLTPRKSLTLAGIDVPEEHLFHCVRGLLEGDGSILRFTYDGGGKAAGRRYEALLTRFNSASEAHIRWLRSRLQNSLEISGNVARPPATGGCWQLNYAISESVVLLPRLYVTCHVPKLARKWQTWSRYAADHGHSATAGSGVAEAATPYERVA